MKICFDLEKNWLCR